MEKYTMVFGESMIGIPTMGLVKARNYQFSISKDTFMMKVPIKGSYTDLDSEFFTEEDGAFEIYDGKDFNVATLSKVLFAAKCYPDLKDNQLFCPLKFNIDENVVTIYGQVVQLGEVSLEEDGGPVKE